MRTDTSSAVPQEPAATRRFLVQIPPQTEASFTADASFTASPRPITTTVLSKAAT